MQSVCLIPPHTSSLILGALAAFVTSCVSPGLAERSGNFSLKSLLECREGRD